jgi:hypothetical protein
MESWENFGSTHTTKYDFGLINCKAGNGGESSTQPIFDKCSKPFPIHVIRCIGRGLYIYMKYTINYIYLTIADFLRLSPSLTKGWVCNLLVQLLLGLARAVALGSKIRRTHDHMLLSHLRLSVWNWSSCGRQSVDQFVWVSGHLSGSLTRF